MSRQKLADSQRRWLNTALAEWQAENLLSADQAERILARYETDEDLGKRKQSLIVLALLGMAAFLLALAVLLLIGYNWDAMPRGAKLAAILIVVAGTQALGFYLRTQAKAPMLSEVVFFLGCMFYGAGIWLVAQVYHIDAHYPDGVWWWAVGVLPFALCLDTLLCHLLFVALMAGWAGMEVLDFSHLGPWFASSGWELPNGAYSLPILALPGLVLAYRKGSPVLVGLYVPLLVWFVLLQAFAWGAGGRSVFWIGSLGAVLLIIAEAHRDGNAMAIAYRLWGVLLSAGSLIFLSSTSFWRYETQRRAFAPYYTGRSPVAAAVTEAVAILALLGIAFLLLVLVKRRADRERPGADHLGELARRQWFPVSLTLCMAVLAFWSLVVSDATLSWVPPAILANLAMLGLAIYLVRVGVREDRVRPFAAGIVYFLVWAFARYIDLFSEAGGMLGASALFFLSAAGLVVVARFWSRAGAARRESGPMLEVSAPFVGAPWLDRTARWVAEHARPIMLVTAVLQVLLLLGMIAVEATPLVVGETIVLRVTPIDPRDLFRGDYVILDYDLNRVAVPGGGRPNDLRDRPVYVTLEPDDDGKHWHAGKISLEKPTEGKYIRGRYKGHSRQPVQFGIEAYFVEEGQGLEWERLRNSRKLSAEIALTSWGQAKLRRLIAEE